MAHPRMKDATMPLDKRIDEALRRISSGHAAMRIPAEATDHDIVLADCKTRIGELEKALETLKSCINVDGTRVLAQPSYMLGVVNNALMER